MNGSGETSTSESVRFLSRTPKLGVNNKPKLTNNVAFAYFKFFQFVSCDLPNHPKEI